MANRDMLSLSAIARAVWNMVAIASRTVRLDTASPGVIKLIQRGTITIGVGVASNTATITAVVTANSVLANLGSYISGGTTDNAPILSLTNSTTVTATRWNNGGADVCTVGYQVVEYY